MNSRLRALGGRINNIRASELPKEKTRSEIICNVHFLDGSVQSFKVNVSLENYFLFKYIEICLKLQMKDGTLRHGASKSCGRCSFVVTNCRITAYKVDFKSVVLIYFQANQLQCHNIMACRLYLEFYMIWEPWRKRSDDHYQLWISNSF